MADECGIWVHWFAWYPVRLNKLVWLQTIERKRVAGGWYLRRLPPPIQADRSL